MNTKLKFFIMFVLLLIAGFLRFYRIDDYMRFLGDEGRDALIVKQMIVDGKFTLLGPITSVGLMHLGPVYYYFMAPFLWAWRLDPVGPAIMVALFSIATILLLWKFCEEFIDTKVAFMASFLYALSPLVITQAKSSWNPNILPFWGLVIIYGLAEILIKNNWKWLPVIGAAFGITIQLHYVALVYLPIIVAVILLVKIRPMILNYFLFAVGWMLTFSPFLLFELRHKFINTLTIFKFITRSGYGRTFGVSQMVGKFWDLTVRLYWRLITVEYEWLAMVLLISVFVVAVVLFFRMRTRTYLKKIIQLLFLWHSMGIGLLSLYSGVTYDYYLMFIFPLPFILTALAIRAFSDNIYIRPILVFAFSGIIFLYIKNTPVQIEPNRLAFQTQEIVDFILSKTSNKPYNFALIAVHNSDHAYRYFFETRGRPPQVIENPDKDPTGASVTNQLFIVCEEKICEPLGHPLWEIAGFGRAELTNEWNVGLFRVFRLEHFSS